MPVDNLAAVALMVKATLPLPTLLEIWTLAHNDQPPEPPWRPNAANGDPQDQALWPAFFRIKLLANGAINIHLEHTRPMPSPANPQDPYRQARQWQTHDQLLRAMRGCGLLYKPDHLAPPELIQAEPRRRAAEQSRLLPLELAARHEAEMQSPAVRQSHAIAVAVALLSAWHTAQGRGGQYAAATARTRLETALRPRWSRETPPTLETWLEPLPVRSHWLLNWTGAAATKRQQATQIHQDALQEVRRCGAKMNAIYQKQEPAATPAINAQEAEPWTVLEPIVVFVRERHLNDGHPWFPESSPLALAANEGTVDTGQYASANYQALRIKSSPGSSKRVYALDPGLVNWLEQYLLAFVNPARTRPDPIKFRLADGKAELMTT